jgi:hypothetical protein
MAVTIKNLGAGALGAEAALVTALDASVLVSNLRITNTTNAALTFTLKVQGTGGTPPVRYLSALGESVPAYSTKTIKEITLSAGWKILGSGGTGLEYVASGIERT